MRTRLPEDIVMVGTIVETYERAGKSIVSIALQPLRLDLEIDGSAEMHLEDTIDLETTITIKKAAPHISQGPSTSDT